MAAVLGGQARSYLPGSVVELPLIETVAVEIVAVDARQRSCMVDAGIDTGGERRQVRSGKQLGDDDGAVDVAFDKVDQHFGAHARGEQRAPVGAGQRFGDADPGAGAFVAGAQPLCRCGAQAARIGAGAALPGELDAHLMVARGGRNRVGQADDERGIAARAQWLSRVPPSTRGTSATVSRTQPKLLR